jgi:hypothetical protein
MFERVKLTERSTMLPIGQERAKRFTAAVDNTHLLASVPASGRNTIAPVPVTPSGIERMRAVSLTWAEVPDSQNSSGELAADVLADDQTVTL